MNNAVLNTIHKVYVSNQHLKLNNKIYMYAQTDKTHWNLWKKSVQNNLSNKIIARLNKEEKASFLYCILNIT